ncbi:MAG TPA: OmpA family protein [Gammaproteobacteria bacterium]|nr:OmpA family protein [Gammaproteobacteria bacterium]
MDRLTLAALGCCVSVAASTQALAQQAIASSDVLSQIPMFSYREGRKSEIDFRGTPIAANAYGNADIEYDNGNARISAKIEELPEPGSLGPYTTYVLWALTPDGRAVNQGVVGGYEGGDGEIKTEYGAPQFALIVTAEPHFAVSAPSTMIALYNIAEDVEGTESKISTLTERSDYSKLNRIAVDEKNAQPLELVQARYAVAIADAAGARQYAPAEYKVAADKLDAATLAAGSNKNSEQKGALGLAREAVIAGEDARRAAMSGAAEAAAEQERLAAAAAAAEAERVRSAAENAARMRNDLYNRLQAALPTRMTDRGFVSEIGGVQFATGTANLAPPAREGLARFAGIVASYPGLRFMVEGHTDDTGTVAANNELSLRRALAVRDYLINQGVAASSTDVAGLGSSRPIADNATADGRARNRRVEIVVAGGPIETGAASPR